MQKTFSPENVHRKDYVDYEFIWEELKRLIALSPVEMIKYYDDHPEDNLCFLNRPDGFVFMFTSAGETRFRQILLRGLKSLSDEALRYDRAVALQALKRQFVARIWNGVEITEGNAHDIFTSALAEMSSVQTPLTHYVPCSLVAHRKLTQFSIGRVEFIERQRFLEERGPDIWNDNCAAPDPILAQLKRFFSLFSWVAAVKVPACDSAVSKRRANATVQRALDLFKLFVGSIRGSYVRRGYDLTAPSRMIGLASTSAGKYQISYDGGKLQDAVINDDWYDQIQAFPEWSIAQSILSAGWQVDSRAPEAQQRFLDGLAWHSDAISEPDPASRVVKFWAAIERVVTLRKGDNITRRAAILNSSKAGFADKYSLAQTLYSRRSAIVHGSANRVEQWHERVAMQSEAFSQHVLYGYLLAVDGLALTSDTDDKDVRRKLQAWFKGTEAKLS